MLAADVHAERGTDRVPLRLNGGGSCDGDGRRRVTTMTSGNAAVAERGPAEAGRQLEDLRRLRFEGPLTAATAPRVRALIRERALRGDVRLLVDLQAVTALDAAGLAALLDGQRIVESYAEGALVLRPNRIVRQALKESGTIAAFALWNGSGM